MRATIVGGTSPVMTVIFIVRLLRMLRMKFILPFCLIAALAVAAQAQESQDKRGQPAPDLNKSPWSGASINHFDGLTGDSTTIIKRDMGGGWAIGGQMTTPYQDPKIGGTGVPAPPQLERPGGHTLFGPYLEKKY
jgi:hypothetical protein